MSTPTAKTPQGIVAEFPASATQKRCWFLDQMRPGNPALNVAVRWELRGNVSAKVLEEAFQYVIARHEVLRTRLVEGEDGPVQQVAASVEFKLDQVDIRAAVQGDPLLRVDAIARENAERPFDLSKAGLLRATLVRFEADRAMLLIVAHQSCFDGYSIGVLGREIGIAADAINRGVEPDLPELPLQYGDYALWQQEYLSSGVLDEETEYWTAALHDMRYFEIEPDRARPAVRSVEGAQVDMDLPPDFGDRLAKAAQARGMSTFAFGCAVFSAALQRMTGESDVSFGSQIAGRNDVDLEPLIGVFINNLVLRFDVDPAKPFAAHLDQAKEVVTGALSHQTMPFNQLVQVLNPVRDAGRNPLISINFNLQTVFMKTQEYEGFALRSSPSHAPGAVYDMDVAVIGRPTGWQMNAEYQSQLFEAETIAAFLDLLAQAFEQAFAEAEKPIATLPLPERLANRRDRSSRALSRVEEALAAHAYVAEAAAISDGTETYGFVTPAPGTTVALETLPEVLMDHLAQKLAEADMPRGVSVLALLPRKQNGALNRALLRPPAQRRGTARAARRAVDPEVAARIRGIWQELLGLETVPDTASFFDLGGDSLLTVRMLTRIREAYGLELGIATAYEYPTLTTLTGAVWERLSAKEEATPAEPDWRILPLRKDGAGVPLISVNNAATPMALAQDGTTPRKATCVRLFEGDHGLDQTDRSFEEVAREYADLVREAQPEGPYLFYGNCVHGNLALETARILHAEGAEIAGVTMKDVWEPGYAEALLKDPKMRKAEKWQALRNRIRMVREGEMSFWAMLDMYRAARKTGIVHMAEALGLYNRAHASDLEEEQQRAISYLSKARDAYRPAPVDFPVLHVVTEITPQGSGFSPSIGWEKVVAEGQLKTVHIPKVSVVGNKRSGTEAFAQEIETFLAERDAAR
ncbi:condensation domain-containing protein [Pseudooceanicola nanhaiensis]|uniref:condensation domain-containing protein n=1 Tax=Pseudooceanicola nanhaiensis TaxID=375761 RepID=UPI001CD5C889|nr:condensation domain-containing protein [Pseudooceanicola nanhaiensis]MCA0921703.1 condensation domain-containing protein [Pseudooceanicola nanhaiensis]